MRARLLVVVAATLGCGHKLESPTPSTSGVSPRLACSEQLTSPIQVMGDNLTPLPTKTLKDQEQLNLPQVSLTEETDLAGTAMSGMPISIADDPNNPSMSHIRWESEQQLTFDVYPQLMLMSGVYDVTVSNPDGQSATFKDALAIVPPPIVIDVVPPNICDAQSDQTIKVDGMNFLQNGTDTPTVTILDANGMPALPSPLPTTTMSCTAVATSVMQGIQECTILNFVVKEGSLPVGMYTLVVTNPAPAGCASSESISFVVEPPPTLTSVLPTHLCQGGGTLDLKGTGFLPGATASLTDDQTMMTTNAQETSVVSSMEAQARFFSSGGFTVGDTMDVTITNADGCFATLPKAVTIIQGPIIFYVDPGFVYGNTTTPVTVYTTGFTDTIASVQLLPDVSPSPSPSPSPIDLTAQSAIDPNHPKRLIIDVPPTVPAGSYDILIEQTSGCDLFYPKGITVVTSKTDLKDILPPFGFDQANTDVTIDATGPFFQPGARAYISPTFGTTKLAVPLTSVVFQNNTQLTAIVPASASKPLPDGVYDVITVNPDGTIGFLANGFTVVPVEPPVITGLSPGQLPTNCTNCTGTLTGSNFESSATVARTCVSAGGAAAGMGNVPINGTPTATTISLNLGFVTAQAAGDICTFRVTQPAGTGNAFADGGTLVVTNPSGNLGATHSGADMNVGRRAPALAFNGPTSAVRYLYAIGGDDGAPSPSPFSSLEFARADGVHGNTGAWTPMPSPGTAAAQQGALPTGRTYAGAASVGRFIYLVGGFDGAKSVSAVNRAEVLDPGEAPQIDDADLNPVATDGLDPGLYFYRVSAVLPASDANNPGGETLTGDEFAINVPAVMGKKVQVTISWINGAATPGSVAKWRIYRTSVANAAPGSEDVFLETTDATTTTFIDKGPANSPQFATGRPLPFGAIGNWDPPQASPLPSPVPQLNTRRASAGVTVAPSPGPANNVFFLYAGYGFDSTALVAAQFPVSYEHLKITLGAAGPVEDPLGWQEAIVTLTPQGGGAPIVPTGRWQLGAMAATPDVDQVVSTNSYIYFTNGLGAGGAVGILERGAISADGSLALPLTAKSYNNASQAGYGALTAVNFLFELGGYETSNNMLLDKMTSVQIGNAAGDLPSSFTPQGGGQIQTTGGTAVPLAFPGATAGGAYFWLAGGATPNLTTATKQTFWVLY